MGTEAAEAGDQIAATAFKRKKGYGMMLGKIVDASATNQKPPSKSSEVCIVILGEHRLLPTEMREGLCV